MKTMQQLGLTAAELAGTDRQDQERPILVGVLQAFLEQPGFGYLGRERRPARRGSRAVPLGQR